jgi:hypothetical protein
MKLTRKQIKQIIREQYYRGGWSGEQRIDDLPSYKFTQPPSRSQNIILDGFKHTGIKVPEMKPITNISTLKMLVKASRKVGNRETIKDVDKIWGLDIAKGKYQLLCIEYEDIGGFKPKRLVLFITKGLVKIASATAAYKIADQVEQYLKTHPRTTKRKTSSTVTNRTPVRTY